MLLMLKLFKEIETKAVLPKSFLKASINLIPKTREPNQKRKLQPISLMNFDAKLLSDKHNTTNHKKDYISSPNRIHLRDTEMAQHMQINTCNTPVTETKKKIT